MEIQKQQQQYIKAKDSSIYDLNGTTNYQLRLTISVLIFSCFFQAFVVRFVVKAFPNLVGHNRKVLAQSPKFWSKCSLYTFDFVITMPIILIGFIFPEWNQIIVVSSITLCLLLDKLVRRRKIDSKSQMLIVNSITQLNQNSVCKFEKSGEEIKKIHLTPLNLYKVYLMIGTVLQILAVDFKVSPRRFAKTQTFGTSPMDLGTGMIVFSIAAASAPLSGLSNTVQSKKQNRCGFLGKLLSSNSIILSIIGLVKFYIHSGLNYQQHVTQYGKQWNFFVTVAVISLVASILKPVERLCKCRLNISLVIGVIIALFYEFIILKKMGMQEFILNAERKGDFLSDNREGIFSTIGYIAIHFIGRGFGSLMKQSLYRGKITNFALLKWIGAISIVNILVSEKFIPCQWNSRRMANLAYIWQIVINSFLVIWELYLIETVLVARSDKSEKNYFTELIGQANFAYFLIGNILTGLVNLSIYTYWASDITGISVITGYMYFSGLLTVLFRHIFPLSSQLKQ